MAVKDLIGLFESSPAGKERHANPETHTLRVEGPPPIPARFVKRTNIQHNSFLQRERTALPINSHPFSTTSDTPFYDNSIPRKEDTEITTDVTEASPLDTVIPTSPSSTINEKHLPASNESELYQGGEEHGHLLTKDLHSYPPDTLPARISSRKRAFASNSTSARNRLAHVPVPAVTLFSRKAAPLYLPQLDDYLASLKPPHFTSLERNGKGKEREPLMFPPMDQLAVSGQTIEELEANSPFPSWKTRGTILKSIVNLFLDLTGSSFFASYYSLQGLFNTVQVFALLLSTIVRKQDVSNKWRNLLLGKIPNILALNFSSTLVQSLLFLAIFLGIATILLFYFHRETYHCEHYSTIEGFQVPEPHGEKWGLVIVSFLLTVIYLPLSTLAIHVLVWSQDLWVVPNPYTNATSNTPLGPPDEFRDPLDFCWTTTMAKDQINFAPVVIIISVIVVLALTLWFPIRLRQVIRHSVPRVDPYTELGQPRSNSDMDREYERLLYRDRSPFSFLYKGFRRNSGTYESTYLFAKFSSLLIIAVIDTNNCLFRTLSPSRIAIARQALLLASTIFFFVLQCYFVPFMDPVDNASEWISRLNYVATAGVALAIALNIPGQNIINGPILYSIYGITYGLSIYFLIINLSMMHRVVKRLACRIDFSVDIFSPRLDLSVTSVHTRRRIWQESITTLFLTSPECRIPKQQRMIYAQARDSEYPPYLLRFSGTPAERHVENLKILREVGSLAYKKAVALVYGPDRPWFKHLEGVIQEHFVGPDCYWKKPNEPAIPGCTKFFGNAWWIPFPPTLVIKYDHGPIAVLQEVSDFELYVAQNSSPNIRRKREIRMSIRALDGHTVLWPYEHIRQIGAYSLWCCGNRRYEAEKIVHYKYCVLRIKYRGHLIWQDFQLASGFEVELIYAKDVRVDGGVIGLNEDFDLTVSLARFFALNQDQISERLEHIQAVLANYRHYYRKEARAKNRFLTYRFLAFVYDQPREPRGLAQSAIQFERDLRVRQLFAGNEAVFQAAYDRLTVVSTSQATRWWYIFWDDLWRRNYDTIPALRRYASDFNPHYPTSIAYTPLPRPALEAFLIQRGLLSKLPKWGYFFHTGFLNKLYLRLNETVFGGSSQGILFHIGDDAAEFDMQHIDLQTQARSSTMGTGGGTDYDQASIQARPTYKWEGLLDDPLRKGTTRRKRWFAKMGAWFGITPLWKSSMYSQGLAADVRLENGRYVLPYNNGRSPETNK